MSFREDVEHSPDISTCYQPGIQAVKEHNKVLVSENCTRFIEGSVDIDTCTRSKYPNASRWDYAVGYKKHIFFIEVHTASDSQVNTMINKLTWLKDWKNNTAFVNKGCSYHWISSNGIHITKNSRFQRQIAQYGLKFPAKMINLEQYLETTG